MSELREDLTQEQVDETSEHMRWMWLHLINKHYNGCKKTFLEESQMAPEMLKRYQMAKEEVESKGFHMPELDDDIRVQIVDDNEIKVILRVDEDVAAEVAANEVDDNTVFH